MFVLDLFSGIGGFSLGLERAGMKTVAFCEIDEKCRQVLKKHWPDVPVFTDVKELNADLVLGKLHLDKLAPGSYFKNLANKPLTQWELNMAGRLKKLTPEQAEECVRMYDAGSSIQDVADCFCVSRQGMWDLLRRRTKIRSNLKYGKENHFYRGGKLASDRAQNILEKAILRGSVEKKYVCEFCGESGKFANGRTKVQAHHPDYNKPLDVIWLCQPCHHEWHKNNTPVPVMEAREESVDVICGGFPC